MGLTSGSEEACDRLTVFSQIAARVPDHRDQESSHHDANSSASMVTHTSNELERFPA
jgi:hypothetical protein